jgi:hypothetical protein
MFLRKSMILIKLLVIFVQEYDSKRVAICARDWLCHLRDTRSPCAEMAGGQISSMFYFNPGVKSNGCRLVPRTGTRDKKAALHRPTRRARSDARFNPRVKRRFGEIPRSGSSLGTT